MEINGGHFCFQYCEVVLIKILQSSNASLTFKSCGFTSSQLRRLFLEVTSKDFGIYSSTPARTDMGYGCSKKYCSGLSRKWIFFFFFLVNLKTFSRWLKWGVCSGEQGMVRDILDNKFQRQIILYSLFLKFCNLVETWMECSFSL